MRRMYSNEQISKVFRVNNIQNINNKVLNALKAGDVVVKLTGNQEHSYRVSYKEENQGICLTYVDASCVETVSYDFTDGE